jgi:hypothetical protein
MLSRQVRRRLLAPPGFEPRRISNADLTATDPTDAHGANLARAALGANDANVDAHADARPGCWRVCRMG